MKPLDKIIATAIRWQFVFYILFFIILIIIGLNNG